MSILKVTSLGNDIVDWTDPDTVHLAENNKFLNRVFNKAELDHCFKLPVHQQYRFFWKLWAAKEAAYKAVRRVHEHSFFSPKLFEYIPDSQVVVYKELSCSMQFYENNEYVYASAIIFDSDSTAHRNPEMNQWGKVQNWIGDYEEIHKLILDRKFPVMDSYSRESSLCRTFAAMQIGQFLDSSEVRIVKDPKSRSNIPEVWVNNEKTRHMVSTSHHGRFCAVLFCPVQ